MTPNEIIEEFRKLIESNERLKMTDSAMIIAVCDPDGTHVGAIVGGGPSLVSSVFDILMVRIGGQICTMRGVEYEAAECLTGESEQDTGFGDPGQSRAAWPFPTGGLD